MTSGDKAGQVELLSTWYKTAEGQKDSKLRFTIENGTSGSHHINVTVQVLDEHLEPTFIKNITSEQLITSNKPFSESVANTKVGLKRVRFLINWEDDAIGHVTLKDVSLDDGCVELDPLSCPVDAGICQNGKKGDDEVKSEEEPEPNEAFCQCVKVNLIQHNMTFDHSSVEHLGPSW